MQRNERNAGKKDKPKILFNNKFLDIPYILLPRSNNAAESTFHAPLVLAQSHIISRSSCSIKSVPQAVILRHLNVLKLLKKPQI